jgi:hypothetical protein
MKLPKDSKLRAFEIHGVEFTGRTGDQYYGYCPFGDQPKFYANQDTGQWDYKPSGMKGNLYTYLRYMAEFNAADADLSALQKDRTLPLEAFTPWKIGFDGTRYTIPVRNYKNRIVDIRHYRIGTKGVWTTKGCTPGLLGAEKLSSAHPNSPIYVCEGEWDAIALQWLLTKIKKNGVVVGLPGASIFRPSWVAWFKNRDVYLCFDNDDPGAQGEVRAFTTLRNVARTVHCLRFPDDAIPGYDVRDWVLEWTSKRKPRAGYNKFLDLFVPEPREEFDEESQEEFHSRYDTPATFQDVERVFNKWLYLENTDGIRIALAAVLSNQLDGDPIWIFLVAPPGGAKTATLSAFNRCPKIFTTSSLTARSLISGMNFRSGVDPSLIPKLDGRVLVIKDFTSIMSLRDNEKDEIFGILRDAYDGYCSKTFGNGITRRYKSRFSLIAAVTPAVYSESAKNTSLGERFLKFTLADNLKHFSEDDIITKAISNVNDESAMIDEMSDVVQSYVSGVEKTVPMIPPRILKRIIGLAKYGARIRASVQRNQYRPDQIEGKPSAEVGSRLGKQIAKMAIALAMVGRRRTVNDDDLVLIKKVILDTVPQRAEDMIRLMWKRCEHEDDSISTRDVALQSGYPIATVSRLLADFNLLGIVSRIGSRAKFAWQITPYVRSCIVESGIYDNPELLERKRMRIKRKKRSKREGQD